MKIWVLTKKDRLKSNQARRFQEEAAALGIQLKHVCSEHFEIVEPSEQADKIWYKGKYRKIPDVLITRETGVSYLSFALMRLLERMGVFVMNTAHSVENAEDKLRTIQLLTAKNIPIPKSILAKFPVDTQYVADQLAYPLIMKTVHGAQGEGVLLFDNHHQFQDVVTILHKETQGKTHLIFQEYIADSYGRDLRVFVVGDQAVGVALRVGAEGQFKANVGAGGSAHPFELTPQLAELAVQASQALGLSIAGVDFLFHRDSFVITEVNSAPQIDKFEDVTGLNVVRAVLDYAIKMRS